MSNIGLFHRGSGREPEKPARGGRWRNPFDPGTTQAARPQGGCLVCGGHYVVLEFSMPQLVGWLDEFRSTFVPHVAQQIFTVEGR